MDAVPPPPPPFPPQMPGVPAKDEGLANASLVLGILSLCCLGCFAGIPAIICGHKAHGKISRSGGTLGGDGKATAGLVMGYISLALSLFVVPILAAIAIPAFSTAKLKTQQVQALNQCSMLTRALDSYHAEYGQWPAGKTLPGREADNGVVMDTLRAINTTDNPRKVVFFEGRNDGYQGNQLVDPWRHPYHIVLDTNGTGTLTVGGEKLNRTTAVWSSGPNGKDEQGAGDDITSWKPLPTRHP